MGICEHVITLLLFRHNLTYMSVCLSVTMEKLLPQMVISTASTLSCLCLLLSLQPCSMSTGPLYVITTNTCVNRTVT